MRTNGGKRQQFVTPANHEKSLVAKTSVNPIVGKTAGRPGIHYSSLLCRPGATIVRGLAAPGQACGHNQKFSAGYSHEDFPSPLIFKNQAGENAPVNIRPRVAVHREDKSEPQPRLDPPDGV
jgi:hypothetical protein